MEPEISDGSNHSSAPKSIGEEDNFQQASELLLDYDLPDLLEFSALEDILSIGSDSPLFPRKQALQRSIAVAEDEIELNDEDDSEDKRFLFICKVCKKSFYTIRACERHIIKRGHTYPLIDLRSSDMNGEVCESIVLPDSLEERGYKTVPSSNFLPVYMGKWSKVICELRHRFGQEPEGDGIFCKNLLHNNHHHHPVDRYSQPDVTQTEPKAPEDEIAHTMKKLNECFQNLVCLPESEMGTNETNGFEPNSTVERNDTPSIDASKEEEEESYNGDQVDGGTCKFNGSGTWPDIRNDLTENERHQEEEKMPRNETLDDYLHRAETLPRGLTKHKIYVDFLANELLCEGCGSTFGSLNEASDHWRIFGPAGDATESSVDVTEGKGDCKSSSDTVDGLEPESATKQIQDSPNIELCQTLKSDDVSCSGDDVPGNDVGQDEAQPNNNDHESGSNYVFGNDNSSRKMSGLLIPFEEKQNGSTNYGTGLGEKELLIIDDKRRNKKKNSKGKKKKKNKPLKFIRRAFMLTLTFLF